MKSDYKEHLKHMEDGYLTQFKEELFKRCTSHGPLERNCWVTEVDSIHDLEDLDVEGLGSHLASYSCVRGEHGLKLPAFVHVSDCEWYTSENSDEGGPVLLAILEHASTYENASTPVREKLVRKICDNVDGVLWGERKISFSHLKEVEKETNGDYIAVPFEIRCEEAGRGYGLIMDESYTQIRKKDVLENRERVLASNMAGITGLIDAAGKYTEITGSYVFQKEERRLEDLPYYVAELFVQIDDSKTIAAILENFRLGTNLTVSV